MQGKRFNTKKMLLFLSATFGTIIAVLSPLLPNTVNILIKIPLALSMILIAFLPNNLKIFFTESITFLISTFAMIGCCLAISELFHVDVVMQNGIIMEYKFPVGIVLLICFVVFVCLKNIYGLIFKRQKLDELSFDITLKNQNNTIKTQAFLDTGNKLMLDEKPITILFLNYFHK